MSVVRTGRGGGRERVASWEAGLGCEGLGPVVQARIHAYMEERLVTRDVGQSLPTQIVGSTEVVSGGCSGSFYCGRQICLISPSSDGAIVIAGTCCTISIHLHVYC